MAWVQMTREEAKDPVNLLPHVCLRCGAPAVIAQPVAFRKIVEEKKFAAPPGEEGTVVAMQILGIWDWLDFFLNLGSTKAVVMTPLCKNCDEEGFPEGLRKLVSVDGNSITLIGVSDAFAVALGKKRESLKAKQS
jgi:hypothetical protein